MVNPRISTLAEAIRQIAPDPRAGLGDELFLLVSSLTPMINVDLLIKDKYGHTLLTWRDDKYYAPGWHLPGGIVRFKEKCADRVRAVAHNELRMEVSFENHPIAINEMVHPARTERGHFVALLYRCVPVSEPDAGLAYLDGRPIAGQWKWHTHCPENIVEIQKIYRKYI